MTLEELQLILERGLTGMSESPLGEDGQRISVRADQMPTNLSVRPDTVPDPSQTTPKDAQLYIFTAEQARKVLGEG